MLPNLLVIGAPKCGTSALHEYLAVHPEVFMSDPKELNVLARRWDWQDHMEWYERQFEAAGGARVRGESSPVYTMWPTYFDVPERAASVIPGAKLIYLVRDPYVRTFAHWRDQYWLYAERRPLEEAVDPDDPENLYVSTSRYGAQLDRWLEHFPGEQILVLEQSGLFKRRPETMRRVFEFLGVDPSFTSPSWDREHNTGSKNEYRLTRLGWALRRRGWLGRYRALPPAARRAVRPVARRLLARPFRPAPMSDDLRARLAVVFEPDQARLAQLRREMPHGGLDLS